jgi:hypothetical protein
METKKGRKLKYGEPTKKVNYRLPVSFIPQLEKYISLHLLKYIKDAKKQIEIKKIK